MAQIERANRRRRKKNPAGKHFKEFAEKMWRHFWQSASCPSSQRVEERETAGMAIHSHPELAVAGEEHARKLDSEVFVPIAILDGNSQICFHKLTVIAELNKCNHARSLG
jgi:hypothetical protein